MSHSLCIYKASAGSGKTFTLAVHYIKLLVINPQNYRHILAVTFTNKATEEMKMRILSQLYGIWRGLDDSASYAEKVYDALDGTLSEAQIAERAGQALQLLLHNYSYFRVETIDSFFQSILRNLTRELNLAANLHVGLNDVQTEEMAVDRLIDSLSASDQLLQWLMKYIMDTISDDRSWNVIGQVKKFGLTIFRDYYKSHREEMDTLMSREGFFDSYQKELRDIRQQALGCMEKIADEFFSQLKAASLEPNDLSYGSSGVAGLFLKLKKGVFDGSVVSKRVSECIGHPEKWYANNSQHSELIHNLAKNSLEPLVQQAVKEQPRQWKLYKSADLTLRHLNQLRLLGSIGQKVRQLNDEQNRFLLSDTQQLLHELTDGSDSPFIFEKIGTQLEHIMIDEFQDTSTVQWQNFKILLQETMSHKGSENLIVGDVKQSIYRWRSGDWRLLAGIKDEFPQAGNEVFVDSLDQNFRSASRIVYFNNAFFAEAAQQEKVTAYDDVKQKVKKSDQGRVEVTLLPAADYEQHTLEALCEQMRNLIANGTPTADIAILVRYNRDIPPIANYLMEQLPGLKVVSDEAFRLDASPAVVAIVTALHHLAHPDDQIAKVCIERMMAEAETTGGQDILNQNLLQLPLYELTEQLFGLLQLDRLSDQSAYLCAFYDHVAAYAAENGSDIDGFLREWDESIASKTIQSPETDGLRIISIHKSKGLEYACVLVPFCDWQLEKADEILWCQPGEKPFSQLPIVPVDFSQKGMKGTIYDQDYKEEHQQNIIDNLNLLYVAFTRPTRNLFVYGRRKAATSSRSALIEQVLPKIVPQLSGATLYGQEDNNAAMTFVYSAADTKVKPVTTKKTKKTEDNPFLQVSTPVKVPIEVLPVKADFKQSNQSRAFAQDDDEEKQSQQEYIRLGNVLHNILSSIRDINDIDSVLGRLEQEGILYDGTTDRHRLLDLLRQRLSSPQVAEWFKPGRWQLYNECTILSTDDITGRVVECRPDRVMTDGYQTIVVDFKFGRDREGYHDQVKHYMHMLHELGHQNVSGYLWLVYSNKVIEIASPDKSQEEKWTAQQSFVFLP